MIAKLRKRGYADSVVRINAESFVKGSTFRIDSASYRIQISDSGRSIETGEVTALWYRRPLSSLKIAKTVRGGFESLHLARTLDDTLRFLQMDLPKRCLQINDLEALLLAKNKLYQLRSAFNLGIPIAPYIVSNLKAEILAFSASRKICVKPLTLQAFIDEEIQCPVWTQEITHSQLAVLPEDAFASPVIVQEIISAEAEYRVVVFGSRAFVFLMDRSYAKNDVLDIRNTPNFTDIHRFVQLPELEDIAVSLCRAFGLFFASMDFLRSTKSYVFLDLNPNGQWLWLEYNYASGMGDYFCDQLVETLR